MFYISADSISVYLGSTLSSPYSLLCLLNTLSIYYSLCLLLSLLTTLSTASSLYPLLCLLTTLSNHYSVYHTLCLFTTPSTYYSFYSILSLLHIFYTHYSFYSQLSLPTTLSTYFSFYLVLFLFSTPSTHFSLYSHSLDSILCLLSTHYPLYSLRSLSTTPSTYYYLITVFSLYSLSPPLISTSTFSLIFPLTSSQIFAELRERVVMQRLQLFPSPNCPSIYKLRSWGNSTISVSGSNVQCSMCSAVNLPNDCKVACFMNEFQIQLQARQSRGVAGGWEGGGGLATYSRMQNTIYYKGKSCRQHDNNNNNNYVE